MIRANRQSDMHEAERTLRPPGCPFAAYCFGLPRSQAHSGAVALIQRFGSAANLNIDLNCLVLDGVYRSSAGELVFDKACAPSAAELETLLNRIIQRVLTLLTRTGHLIERSRIHTARKSERLAAHRFSVCEEE
jgi:hypothetical protein